MQMHRLASAFAAHTQNIGVNEDSDESPLDMCVTGVYYYAIQILYSLRIATFNQHEVHNLTRLFCYNNAIRLWLQEDMVDFVICDNVMESLKTMLSCHQ